VTAKRFPKSIQRDIQTAISILRPLGAQHVYIFGSLVESRDSIAARDIDIAVEGLPREKFFAAYGRLLLALDHQFDLVDLASDEAFIRRLKESGKLEQVA
jgi:predicted nucleotidyltransferase